MRTNGIEQISVHTACVTSANVDSWTVHRLSVEPVPGPVCTNVSLKAELGASCSSAEGWACFKVALFLPRNVKTVYYVS